MVSSGNVFSEEQREIQWLVGFVVFLTALFVDLSNPVKTIGELIINTNKPHPENTSIAFDFSRFFSHLENKCEYHQHHIYQNASYTAEQTRVGKILSSRFLIVWIFPSADSFAQEWFEPCTRSAPSILFWPSWHSFVVCTVFTIIDTRTNA